MTDSVDIILLAAGLSSRFGRENKLLQTFRGKSLLVRALELACSSATNGEPILVYSAPETEAEAKRFPVRRVHNPHPEHGFGVSVELGVAASTASHYLFVLCDQPLLDGATIDAVVSRRCPGGIVVPRHAGRPGNPALFSSFFRRELLTLPAGQSPRLLKERHADRVEAVDIENPWPLRDADTPEDLRTLEKTAPG